jgi:sulfur relay (sulfurtransferase) complex TusBCD TusD component (DsrE family)
MSDKETSLAFVERMELLWNQHNEQLPFSDDCFSRFSDLAHTAALMEEHRISIFYYADGLFDAVSGYARIDDNTELATAVRAVADRIKEQA